MTKFGKAKKTRPSNLGNQSIRFGGFRIGSRKVLKMKI
jgi:hypothetical protein